MQDRTGIPEARVPCGHDDDCVRLAASVLAVAYCSRCERAFELGPVDVVGALALVSLRHPERLVAFP